MKKFNLLSSVLLVGILLFVGCSKDNDDDNTPPEVTQLAIQEKLDEIEVPENLANSQSIYALQVNAYVSLIKSIASYFIFFDPVESAEYDDGTYFWTSGAQSIWMVYSETSDAYVFDMDVDFGNGLGRVNYISSQENKDGSGGWLRIYDYTDEIDDEYVFEYTWEINSDGSVTVSYIDKEDNDILELYGHPDDSGYLKSYDGGVLEYEFVWNSDGSGYYYEYDASGNITDEDNWTVADL